MNPADAARRWKEAWEHGWPRRDVEAVAALYAPGVAYRALAFREPEHGIDGVRRYLSATFKVESDVTCRFGEPIVEDSRAAVEWWASWVENGRELSIAGVTILRFDTNGLVVDHRDYWNEQDGRHVPHPGW